MLFTQNRDTGELEVFHWVYESELPKVDHDFSWMPLVSADESKRVDKAAAQGIIQCLEEAAAHRS